MSDVPSIDKRLRREAKIYERIEWLIIKLLETLAVFNGTTPNPLKDEYLGEVVAEAVDKLVEAKGLKAYAERLR